MVARAGEAIVFLQAVSPGEQDAGDHKGNKCRTHRPSSALAPTDVDGLVLRLMRMRADQSAVGAINRVRDQSAPTADLVDYLQTIQKPNVALLLDLVVS